MHARLALALAVFGCAPAARPLPAYPPSRATDFKETLHGVELADPYRWLEELAFLARELDMTVP